VVETRIKAKEAQPTIKSIREDKFNDKFNKRVGNEEIKDETINQSATERIH
jgi:hypothetical protein